MNIEIPDGSKLVTRIGPQPPIYDQHIREVIRELNVPRIIRKVYCKLNTLAEKSVEREGKVLNYVK